MPVLYDSGNGAWGQSTSAAGGTVSYTHTISTLATDRFACVLVLWIDNIDVSTGTLTASFGGTSMTAQTAILWNSNRERLQLFTLSNPGTGPKTVLVTMSGLTGTGSCGVLSSSYSGVASVGTVGLNTPATSASNSITQSSVAPAYRVVTAHGSTNPLTNYNQTLRALGKFQGGMILGDSPGATSVTATATQNSTAQWGAYSIPLTPATVVGQTSLSVDMSMSAGGSLYRVGDPDPKRYWLIEA